MVTRENAQLGKRLIRFYTPWAGAQHPEAVRVSTNQKNGIHQISPYMDIRASIKGAGEGAQTHRVLLGKRINPTPFFGRIIPTANNSSPSSGPDISGDSHGRSMDSHEARLPIGRLEMAPFIFSHVQRTDHGPCADP